MSSKIVLAIPLALLLLAGMHYIDGVGDRSSGSMIAHAQSFNAPECEEDCRFRYNIRTDRCSIPMQPTDTPTRIGYEKCLTKCEQGDVALDDIP